MQDERKIKAMLKFTKPRIIAGATHGLMQSALVCELTADLPAPVIGLNVWIMRAFPEFREVLGTLSEKDGLVLDAEGVAQWIVRLGTIFLLHLKQPVRGGHVEKTAVSGTYRLVLPSHDSESAHFSLGMAQLIVEEGLACCLGTSGAGNSSAMPSWEWINSRLGKVKDRAPIPEMLAFLRSAEKRDIPWIHLEGSVYQLGYGTRSHRLNGNATTERSSDMAKKAARKKNIASSLMAQGGIPVPRNELAHSPEKCVAIAEKLGYPVVVKPTSQDRGNGVTAGLKNKQAVLRAYEVASEYGLPVMVEKHIEGEDYRMLVVGGHLIAAAHRTPAGVIGDGKCSVRELVHQANSDPRRGTGKAMLILLRLDEEALGLLKEAELDPDAVPEVGRFVRLTSTANISMGGTSNDVTTEVHPDNRRMAERATRMVGLDIAGVDFLTPDITRSYLDVGGAVCEVNGGPGFRVHFLADPERDIAGEILEWMFERKPARIPIAAITGTDDKSAVAQLLHRILLVQGLVAGVSSAQGVWIGEDVISRRHLEGYAGGRILLTDTMVEAAVIEIQASELVDTGFPFDYCDVAAICHTPQAQGKQGTGISADAALHFSGDVLKRARQAVVLNVEDPLCMQQLKGVSVKVTMILVAQDSAHPLVQAHLAAGGMAVTSREKVGQNGVELHAGTQAEWVIGMCDIAVSRTISLNPVDVLFAVALAHAMGASLAQIHAGLIRPGVFDV
jgi:cyanophycin synthetase